MDAENVEPLRITKSTSNSPSKTPTMSRPLSELNPMGARRNSPSVAQNTLSQKQSFNRESSPFEPSPKGNTTLSYWKNRESNSPGRVGAEVTPSVPTTQAQSRRVSVEALKKASRVNNNIFTRKFETEGSSAPFPASRPIGGARPLSTQVHGNAFGGLGVAGLRNNLGSFRGHVKADSESRVNFMPQDENRSPLGSGVRSISPSKEQVSPIKSSLSRASRYAEGEEMTKATAQADKQTVSHVLRRPKSVVFDSAPPQINEYEHITPVPSSVASGSREGSYEVDPYDMDDDYPDPDYEREDSFEDSLEDTEKTPVVLPDDWRHMSPDAANTDLARTFEDPFDAGNEESPSANAMSRSNSINRPLPPLPGLLMTAEEQDQAAKGKLERSQSFQRILPSTPRAPSISKQDIISMREASPMPLEERLRLLSVQRSSENLRASSLAEQIQEESTVNEESEAAEFDTFKSASQEVQAANITSQFRPPSRISRESILRKVDSQAVDSDLVFDAELDDENDLDDETYEQYADLDPDVPIPSRETSGNFDEVPVIIKHEEEDESDLMDEDEDEEDRDQAISHAMRVAHELGLEPPVSVDYGRESSVVHHIDLPHQTLPMLELPVPDLASNNSTSRDVSKSTATSSALLDTHDTGFNLPDFSSFVSGDDLNLGLHSYLSAEPEDRSTMSYETEKKEPTYETQPTMQTSLMPPTTLTTKASFESMAGSVIHHSISGDSDEEEEEQESMSERSESPEVPEPVATIKATGMKLKTRVSATPADIQAMAATRRLVSGEIKLPVLEDGEEEDLLEDEDEEMSEDYADEHVQDISSGVSRQPSTRIPSMGKMKLDFPIGDNENDFSFGMDEEFERLMDAQKVQFDPNLSTNTTTQKPLHSHVPPEPPKHTFFQKTNLYTNPQRGYVMRQNTKVVVASNRNVSEAIPQQAAPTTTATVSTTNTTATTAAPAKQIRKPSEPWKAEPWNGKMRRQSTRRSNIVPEKRMSAVPPLPGQASNAEAIDAYVEDQLATENDDPENPVERGRLFVKVVQVKDLDLPLPRYGRCEFMMTLDNGMHCVTTSALTLGKNSAIGQEFELVVFDDLEFQLTLQTELPKPPKSPQSTVFSMNNSFKPSSKVSKLKSLLSGGKKRREQELREREQQEQANLQHQQDHRSNQAPGQWELQHELVGPDGSFARAYISLKDHEKQAFGRPYVVDVPCFNEWAVEDKSIASSTRSKMGGIQRRPPYKIAKMELQMMYIPRPRGAKEEDMPRSMSAALRQLREAENVQDVKFEGHLSQQGGDCPYWRRRFFKLDGSKLTAYHETTRQPRVSISLAKAVKLIDDRPALTQAEPTAKNRRKSAFAEDEEGYMFVEEGFRIRFANGEVIDFYADNTKDKQEWMKVLQQVVGRELAAEKITWASAVMARERAVLAKTGGKAHHLEEDKLPIRGPSKTLPASPVKKSAPSASASPTKKAEARVPIIEEEPSDYQPSPPVSTAAEKQNMAKRFSAQAPPPEKETSTRSKRAAIKSMIF